MQIWRFQIQPVSAFATPMLGDTLFGQLCWALRHREGAQALTQQLEAYTQGHPFVVLSDAMPSGFFPRPQVPLFTLSTEQADAAQRKAIKKQQWMALETLNIPMSQWLNPVVKNDKSKDASDSKNLAKAVQQLHIHNTINRQTGTTGQGVFSPYAVAQTWYCENVLMDMYCVLDESRCSIEQLHQYLKDIGQTGFGKDASVGLGRFDILSYESIAPLQQNNPTAVLTLGPCAPQGLGFNAQQSFWQPFTRYGKHGSFAALGAQHIKNPILMAKTGSVFTLNDKPVPSFVGQGLGGQGLVSKQIPETIHQGYAPVIGVDLQPVLEQLASEVC